MKTLLDSNCIWTIDSVVCSGGWNEKLHHIMMELSWDLLNRDSNFEEIRNRIDRFSNHMRGVLNYVHEGDSQYWYKRRANTEWYLKAITYNISKQANPGYLTEDNFRDWFCEVARKLRIKGYKPSEGWVYSLPEKMRESLKDLTIGC